MAITPSKAILALAVAAAVAVLAYALLTLPDQRTTGERIGNAIDALPAGIDKAGRQLERRTPGEKLGDAIKDLGNGIKKSTSHNE